MRCVARATKSFLGAFLGFVFAAGLLALAQSPGIGVPMGSGLPKDSGNALQISSASGLPSGAIVMIASGACPAGFSEDDSLAGAYLLGTSTANADVGTTGGSSSYTPAGSVSAPTFTGTPGTVPAETFTGTAQTWSTQGKATGQATDVTGPNPYTPAGTNSTATFTPSGTVSAPAFTGTTATITPPYYKVIFCKAQ